MCAIPEGVQRQITHPEPNWSEFRAVILGEKKPSKVHLAELFADQEIMEWVTEHVLGKRWTPMPEDGDRGQAEQHYRDEINYWYRMGYDYIRVSGGLAFTGEGLKADDTAELAKKQRGWADFSRGPIGSWEDFERYPWPEVKDEDLWHYEFVANHLPDGMGMLICPLSGFLEIPLDHLIGYEKLAILCYDEPELVKAVFDRCRELVTEVYRRLIDMPEVVGCFQGDDMGFKTATLMPPSFLKRHSLPGHYDVAKMAHERDKVYFLHSCGNLEAIMDTLIDEIQVDAKHSFEDAIIPVEQMYDRYGKRVGLLGGLDVNILAGGDEADVRKRSRAILDHCVPGGRYAFGSGNSVANYCKPENVLAMLDEAYCWRG